MFQMKQNTHRIRAAGRFLFWCVQYLTTWFAMCFGFVLVFSVMGWCFGRHPDAAVGICAVLGGICAFVVIKE